MKGLLLKDIYSLKRELLYFLLFALITFAVQNDFLFSFIIVYTSVLPISALVYDERAKWNKLVDMLPFTPNQIIGSKYLLGCFAIAAATLFAIACQAFGPHGIDAPNVLLLLIVACLAMLLEAVQLPLIFGLGTERGRLLFTVVTVLTACTIYSIPEILKSFHIVQTNAFLVFLFTAAALAAILGSLLSFQISKAVYRRRA